MLVRVVGVAMRRANDFHLAGAGAHDWLEAARRVIDGVPLCRRKVHGCVERWGEAGEGPALRLRLLWVVKTL